MNDLFVNGSPNPAFIREKDLELNFCPGKFVDALFPVYKKNKFGHQKTTYLLSTEELLKWSN